MWPLLPLWLGCSEQGLHSIDKDPLVDEGKPEDDNPVFTQDLSDFTAICNPNVIDITMAPTTAESSYTEYDEDFVTALEEGQSWLNGIVGELQTQFPIVTADTYTDVLGQIDESTMATVVTETKYRMASDSEISESDGFGKPCYIYKDANNEITAINKCDYAEILTYVDAEGILYPPELSCFAGSGLVYDSYDNLVSSGWRVDIEYYSSAYLDPNDLGGVYRLRISAYKDPHNDGLPTLTLGRYSTTQVVDEEGIYFNYAGGSKNYSTTTEHDIVTSAASIGALGQGIMDKAGMPADRLDMDSRPPVGENGSETYQY
jgi:hypothetical protein